MKYLNLKRFSSLILSGALALSLAAPAFASAPNMQTEITGAFQQADIAVTVPTKGAAIINPFGLDLKLKEIGDDGNAATGAVDATISGQKIVTAPMFISNESEMNLQVGATVTGTAVGDLRFASESAAASTSKSVYAYLQAAPATALTGLSTALTAANKAAAYAAWAPEAYDAETDVIVSDREASTTNLVTLKAATLAGSGASATITYKAGSIAMVRLSGDCPTSPRDGWTAADPTATPAVVGDGFTVNVAYTFTPVELEKFTLVSNLSHVSPATADATAAVFKVDNNTVTSAAAGDTVTVDVTVDSTADGITWTVVDATSNNAIAGLTGSVAKNNTDKARSFTFTMPAQNVKVNIVSNGYAG